VCIQKLRFLSVVPSHSTQNFLVYEPAMSVESAFGHKYMDMRIKVLATIRADATAASEIDRSCENMCLTVRGASVVRQRRTMMRHVPGVKMSGCINQLYVGWMVIVSDAKRTRGYTLCIT
jgi:hypothetical protein